MIAFLVSVNGQRVCLAGVGDHCVLGSTVDWVSGRALSEGTLDNALALRVGGLNTVSKEHLSWKTPQIKVGDEITIKIVEADNVDTESRRFAPAQHNDDN